MGDSAFLGGRRKKGQSKPEWSEVIGAWSRQLGEFEKIQATEATE